MFIPVELNAWACVPDTELGSTGEEQSPRSGSAFQKVTANQRDTYTQVLAIHHMVCD